MLDAMLSVEHVDKSFPAVHGAGVLLHSLLGRRVERRGVLYDISLRVGRGELFGVLGPNGAGKTTLLKLLATLIVPERGRMVVDGIDVEAQPLEAKRRIALCTSDERSFYWRLTARNNLEFFGALVGLSGAHLRRRIEECAALVDLSEHLDRRFGDFSAGMRVRLTVARALLGDPAILFFDEPTRAVDPIHAQDIRSLIRKDLVERGGKTVILATNVLVEAWELCDRVAVVNRGRIVALGPPRTLDLDFRALVRYHVTLDDVDEGLLARARTVPGVRAVQVVRTEHGIDLEIDLDPIDGALGALMREISGNGTRLRDFRRVESEPLDVFKRVTSVGSRN